MNVLSDISLERAVLSTIYHEGYSAFLDVSDTIEDKAFTSDSNKIIFNCFQNIFNGNKNASPDIPGIISAAHRIGVGEFFQSKTEAEHLQAITNFPSKKENLINYCEQLFKLQTLRYIYQELQTKSHEVIDFTGDESIEQILNILEFNFDKLFESSEKLDVIGSGLLDFVQELEADPVDQIGISTGYPTLDEAIGGGLRDGAVTVFGARPGVGKSTICNNIASFSSDKDIPCLYLDTEMMLEDQRMRLLALRSGVPIKDIETGQFSKIAKQRQDVYKSLKNIENLPYVHKNISNISFQEQIAIIRKFLINNVGLDENGHAAKKAVILYDYLKLTSDEGINDSIKEFQALGFRITALHNLAVRYKIPIVCTIQLNRDGITKESTDTASGSDRIIWLCSNFIIFKPKSDEEIAKDGDIHGNRKMVIMKSRHGSGADSRNYISFKMNGAIGRLEEGKTAAQIENENKHAED